MIDIFFKNLSIPLTGFVSFPRHSGKIHQDLNLDDFHLSVPVSFLLGMELTGPGSINVCSPQAIFTKVKALLKNKGTLRDV